MNAAFFDEKRCVQDRTGANKGYHQAKQFSTLRDVKVDIVLFTTDDGACMQTVMLRQSGVYQPCVQMINLLLNTVPLLMQDKGEDVIWRMAFVGAEIS